MKPEFEYTMSGNRLLIPPEQNQPDRAGERKRGKTFNELLKRSRMRQKINDRVNGRLLKFL